MDEALDLARRALQDDSGNLEATRLARAHMTSGRHEQALADLELAWRHTRTISGPCSSSARPKSTSAWPSGRGRPLNAGARDRASGADGPAHRGDRPSPDDAGLPLADGTGGRRGGVVPIGQPMLRGRPRPRPELGQPPGGGRSRPPFVMSLPPRIARRVRVLSGGARKTPRSSRHLEERSRGDAMASARPIWDIRPHRWLVSRSILHPASPDLGLVSNPTRGGRRPTTKAPDRPPRNPADPQGGDGFPRISRLRRLRINRVGSGGHGPIGRPPGRSRRGGGQPDPPAAAEPVPVRRDRRGGRASTSSTSRG